MIVQKFNTALSGTWVDVSQLRETPPGGYSNILDIRRLGSYFGVQNIEFPYFFWGGGFQKNVYFGGWVDFVDIFLGGHHKIGLYLGVISMHFRDFS